MAQITARRGPNYPYTRVICDWCGEMTDWDGKIGIFRLTVGWKAYGPNYTTAWWMCPDCIADGWIIEAGPSSLTAKRYETTSRE